MGGVSGSRRCSGSVLRALPLALVLICGGCATTQPWERELLAEPVMSPDDDPDEGVLRAHLHGTREGAVGGFGGGGGGCGCN
ncbi:MAG: DUF4266 domain-containing protein [Myxococcales bacterium]|nr:DUF4266 domain-containing protein [Myxococcales bacterium]